MSAAIRTDRTVRDRDSTRERLTAWILLEGNRVVVAGALLTLIVAVFGTLVLTGVVSVRPDGYMASMLGSGLVGGVVTLLTIALSINQLIVSRVFGNVDSLTDRLDGARELRSEVASLAGEPSTPNDPAAFLSLLARTLDDRVATLLGMAEAGDWDPSSEVTSALRDVGAFGANIDAHLENQTSVDDVLTVILGTEYATNMVAIRHIRNAADESLADGPERELQAIADLLEALAVIRQFFKTIALQRDFAELSRLLVYTGLVALLTSISLTLIYRTHSVTVPDAVLPVVISLGIGVILAPLTVFVAYLLRAATVAHRTVSVGPFVPP